MISFTSSIPLSTEKTPLTLDWAEENYELFSQGMLFKSFAIVKQNVRAYCNLVYTGVRNASLSSYTYYGSRLAFKSEELAEYAGKQFIDIYADYLF